MIALLDMIGQMSGWFMQLPRWAFLSIYGVLVTYGIAAGGFALARAGIKPLWVLLWLVPNIGILSLWLWAYGAWPRERQQG